MDNDESEDRGGSASAHVDPQLNSPTRETRCTSRPLTNDLDDDLAGVTICLPGQTSAPPVVNSRKSKWSIKHPEQSLQRVRELNSKIVNWLKRLANESENILQHALQKKSSSLPPDQLPER
jgi:hypothetical protein